MLLFCAVSGCAFLCTAVLSCCSGCLLLCFASTAHLYTFSPFLGVLPGVTWPSCAVYLAGTMCSHVHGVPTVVKPIKNNGCSESHFFLANLSTPTYVDLKRPCPYLSLNACPLFAVFLLQAETESGGKGGLAAPQRGTACECGGNTVRC